MRGYKSADYYTEEYLDALTDLHFYGPDHLVEWNVEYLHTECFMAQQIWAEILGLA